MRLLSLSAEAYNAPLRGLWETAQGRSEVAYNVRASALLEDGSRGRAEVSPRSYVTGETQDTVLQDIAGSADRLCGEDYDGLFAFSNALKSLLPDRHSARALAEIVFFDALARAWKVPRCRLLGGACQEVKSDLSISIAPPDETARLAWDAFDRGFRHLKLKVGGLGVEEEARRVLAVREAVPGALLRIDANQAFSAEEAVVFIEWLAGSGVPVECFEQPVSCTDLDGLAQVTSRSPVPIIADESVLTPQDALRLVKAEAADGFNIKLAKSGIRDSLEIIAIARAAGWKLMLGCMLESALGSSMAVHLACGTGSFHYIDLDSHYLISGDEDEQDFVQDGETLRLKRPE
ncbi:MAG: dipeptide epimerase [Armatimonadetes bacterium]|nr:dipeptide epimerase [Armatimonadota bacterium]